jgi:hypothetical protein
MKRKPRGKAKAIPVEVVRLACDIKRLWNLRGKPLKNPQNIEVVRWAERNVVERLGRLVSDPGTAVQNLKSLAQELQRPHRTDLQWQFAKAHDEFCRENNGQLPTYGAIQRKLETIGQCHSIGILRRANNVVIRGRPQPRLPMSGKTGRPRKIVRKKTITRYLFR